MHSNIQDTFLININLHANTCHHPYCMYNSYQLVPSILHRQQIHIHSFIQPHSSPSSISSIQLTAHLHVFILSSTDPPTYPSS